MSWLKNPYSFGTQGVAQYPNKFVFYPRWLDWGGLRANLPPDRLHLLDFLARMLVFSLMLSIIVAFFIGFLPLILPIRQWIHQGAPGPTSPLNWILTFGSLVSIPFLLRAAIMVTTTPGVVIFDFAAAQLSLLDMAVPYGPYRGPVLPWVILCRVPFASVLGARIYAPEDTTSRGWEVWIKWRAASRPSTGYWDSLFEENERERPVAAIRVTDDGEGMFLANQIAQWIEKGVGIEERQRTAVARSA